MKELITKDDLIQLGYPKYTSIQIIRQAKQMMVQKGYPFYNNKRLEEWKARQAKIGIHDFVFSYDRMPMLKSTISRIIGRFAKLANVHRVQAKGLRHSHASYLINEFNVSVLILLKRLGHSSPEITLKHYSHMWSGVDELIAEEIAGNITIQTAQKSGVSFIGNQTISNKKVISG